MKITQVNGHCVAGITDGVAKHWIVRTRNLCEVRPDDIVEQVCLQSLQSLLPRINGDGELEILREIRIDQHRQAGNMVKMSVGQEYVPNRVQFGELKVADAGTGIKQDIAVDEHCGGTGSGTDSTAAAQYSYTHTVVA